MLARGIDMIQQYSCDPVLYEGNGLCAHDYVDLAVQRYGPIPEKSRRGPEYVWGDALEVLEKKRPDVRMINLETSVTTSDKAWPMKGIHYRMHPKNVNVIGAARIDACILANNHTADWGFPGLLETLQTLKDSGLSYAGAGINIDEAQAPAVFDLPGKGRVLVFSGGHMSSGIPDKWRATAKQEGLYMVDVHNPSKAVGELKSLMKKYRKDGDIVVLSLHWGGNWGFEIESSHKKFAHAAIKEAGVDVIYGHSSHHVRGVEVYHGKLIIYGCGDFLNDYEGITGHENYRGDLALMYFADVDPATGKLAAMQMVPTQTRHFRVNLASETDTLWLQTTMSRECQALGCDTKLQAGDIHLVFDQK